MTPMPQVLRGSVRNYDWGVINGLTPWGAETDGRPQAEMWFGCHPAAPSPLRDEPDRNLGDVWGDYRPPLLVKILAAAGPLSLQVHPTTEQIGRMRTDASSSRLLADDVEKTEMLLADQPFTTLSDWRPIEIAHRLLAEAGAAAGVLEALQRDDRADAVGRLLGSQPLSLTEAQWSAAARAAHLPDSEAAALVEVARAFGTDPGVAVAALLQPQQLAAGDAVYVPAGVPHAYVHGLGIEVMRNSDNVLRLGLTSKEISVPDALAALEPRLHSSLLRGSETTDYRVAGAPFRAIAVTESAKLSDPGYRLVLQLAGVGHAEVQGESFDLGAGDALAVPPGNDTITFTTTGQAAAAAESS